MALRSSGACRAEKSGFVPWFIGKTTSCAAPPTWSWNTSKRTFDDPASLRKVALTHAEMAAQLSEALHRPVAFVDLPEQAFREALRGFHMPDWQADGLVEDYAHYRRGEASNISSAVQEVTGESPRPFRASAHDYKSAFLDKKDMEQTQFKQGSGGSPRVHAGEGAL
jgi:hypothetical protein